MSALYTITFYAAVDKLQKRPQQFRGDVVLDFTFDDRITCRLVDPALRGRGFYRLAKRDEGTLWCRGEDADDQRALAVAFALSPGFKMECANYAHHAEFIISLAGRAA